MATLTIDADGHVRDTDEGIRPFLEAPYNERPRLSAGAPRDGSIIHLATVLVLV